jgi:catechol 2,3-dioxygenase-like lactoylglutathione lyase family enzyme
MLQHVSIEVAPGDQRACVAFYELIGFHEVDPPGTLAETSTWVEKGGTQVHLLHSDDPVVPPEGHLAVIVGRDSYDATLERLRAAGFDPDPREEHWGEPRSFVRDPAGHRVELMVAPPA